MSQHNSNHNPHLSSGNESIKQYPKSNNQKSSQTSSQYSNLQTYITPSQASCKNYQNQAFNFGQNKSVKRASLSVMSNGGRKKINKSDADPFLQYQNSVTQNYGINRPRPLSKSISIKQSTKFNVSQKQNTLFFPYQKEKSTRSLQRLNNYSSNTLQNAFHRISDYSYSAYNGFSNFKNRESYMINNQFEDIREAKIQLESGQEDFYDNGEITEQKKQLNTTQSNTRIIYYQDQMINEQYKREECFCNFLQNNKAESQPE